MAKFKGIVCDNCEQPVPLTESPWKVRGTVKPKPDETVTVTEATDTTPAVTEPRTAKVATLDLCNECATELFGDSVKDLKVRERKAKGTVPAKKTAAAKPAA